MPRPRAMHVLWLLLLLLVSPGSSAWQSLQGPGAMPKAQPQQPLLALAGTDLLLPCVCPVETRSFLIWQKTLAIAAHYDPEGDAVQDVDGSFRNRTRLYYPEEKGNCSLLLHRVSVQDEGNYSCYYKSEQMKRFDMELLVAAQYTAHVESLPPESDASTGSAVYRCQAAGGYPAGQLRWLLDDRPVDATFEIDRGNRDGLYNLSSTVSVDVPEGAVLRCVVDNPRLEGRVSAEPNRATRDTQKDAKQPEPKLQLPVVAVASGACAVLILGIGMVHLRRRLQRSRRSAGPEGPDGTVFDQMKALTVAPP